MAPSSASKAAARRARSSELPHHPDPGMTPATIAAADETETDFTPDGTEGGLDRCDFVESSQEAQAYYATSNPIRTSQASVANIDFSFQIDPVNRALTANLELALLIADTKSSPLPVRHSLLQGLRIINPSICDIREFLETDATKLAEARARKNITAGRAFITRKVSGALRYLWKEHGFLCNMPYPAVPKPADSCGAFFVEKSDKITLRIILDGRHANVHFKSKFSSFSYFSLETLRHVLGNLGAQHDKYYALNFDLRHWFHQVPLPTIYRQFLAMNLRDQGNEDGEFFLFPKSLPMGWVYSPCLAQCTTCALLLSEPVDEYGERTGKSMEGSYYQLDHDYLKPSQDVPDGGRRLPPTWIPLKGGGGVFVFLDNILVLTPYKATADKWYDKIINSCKHYHAILKGLDEDKYDSKGYTAEAHKEILREKCYVTLERNSNASFDFLGVSWFHHEKQVILKDDTQEMFSKGIQSDGSWSGSRRLLAGVLGKIMWYRRVHGISYHDANHRLQSEALLAVYSALTPERNPGSGWDQIVVVPPGHVPGLQAAGARRFEDQRLPNEGFRRTDLHLSEVLFAATDAAIDQSTPGVTAHLIYSPTDSASGQFFSPSSLPDFSSMAHQVGNFHEKPIAFGEMLAIQRAVHSICSRSTPPRLLVLGTDNMNCKHWIEREHSHRSDINDLMSDIVNNLRRVNCRLYVAYVPTEENVADSPTRKKPFERLRLENTHQRLCAAFAESTTGTWQIAGGQIGGTNNNIKSKNTSEN